MKKFSLLMLSVGLGALLAGCGGSGGSSAPTTTTLQFTGDANYNGEAGFIQGGHPTAEVASGVSTTLSLPYGDRTLSVYVYGQDLSAGQTIALGDVASNASILYSEAGADAPRTWATEAGSGTMTVLAVENRRITVRLDNVTLVPWSIAGEPDATGNVQVRGQIANAVVLRQGGQFDVEFDSEGGTSANIGPFPDDTQVGFVWNDGVTSLSVYNFNETGSDSRSLSLSVPETVPVGQPVDLPSTGFEIGYRSGEEGEWEAVSGTVTVVRRAADGFVVRLDDVRFEPADGSPSATGAFVANGTIGKE